VSQFKSGDEVFGVTNPQFVGANAEFAVASANMVAVKPERISSLEAASIPVVAVTAWQMLFEYARPEPGHTIMILGAAGNVGAYAVQFAASAGFHVVAVVGSKDVEYVRTLGAEDVIDYRAADFATPRSDVRSAFFYAEVTTARLNAISRFLEKGHVIPHVGSVLPLVDVRTAHEMLAGAPHRRGKIMLQVA
jgi:NADPH:quinone reductase-like Zn-dependent oxidoreductase